MPFLGPVPTALLSGPQAWLAGPHTWLDGPEGGIDGRTEGWIDRQMDGRTDRQTKNLPILQDFVPYRGCYPTYPHENQGESRAGQGNR